MGTVIDLSYRRVSCPDAQAGPTRTVVRKRAALFRDAAATYGEGPTAWTSDAQILDIYKKVTQGFRDACRREGKRPPNRWIMNFIMLKFLEVREVVGAEMIEPLFSVKSNGMCSVACERFTTTCCGRKGQLYSERVDSRLVRCVRATSPPFRWCVNRCRRSHQ